MNKLNKVFEELFSVSSVDPKQELRAINGWDSFTHMVLITSTETAFSTMFTAEEIGKFTTVASIIDTLKEKGAWIED